MAAPNYDPIGVYYSTPIEAALIIRGMGRGCNYRMSKTFNMSDAALTWHDARFTPQQCQRLTEVKDPNNSQRGEWAEMFWIHKNPHLTASVAKAPVDAGFSKGDVGAFGYNTPSYYELKYTEGASVTVRAAQLFALCGMGHNFGLLVFLKPELDGERVTRVMEAHYLISPRWFEENMAF